MCSVTWNSAVRLVFCGSSEVGSACNPTLRMPPRFGWPAAAAAVGAGAGAVVGLAAAVGCAAGAGAVVGLAGAGAVVAAAAGAVVGATTGAMVGAAAGGAVVAGPHADRSNTPAASTLSDERGRSIG